MKVNRIISLIILAASLAAVAQQPPATPPDAPPTRPQLVKLTPKVPTDPLAAKDAEISKLKASGAWKDMKNLQSQANQMQTNYQNALRELQAKYGEYQKAIADYHDAVCKENGWTPSEANYDPETDSWTKVQPPAKPADKPATKPEATPTKQ